LGLNAIERQLVEHEGFRSSAYIDTRGYITIGYGRMIDRRAEGGITMDEGIHLLRNDIAKTVAALYQSFRWFGDLDEIRKRVLIDMAFNMGIAKLLRFRETLAAIERKDWAQAAEGIRSSLYARQVGNRAERLARMMETGEAVAKWW
jgi:lysozyme